jgi:S-adenosylmethionine hydrolase
LSPALRPVVFLTDFGHEDEFTGVCRVVIDRISPGVKVVDLSHGIPPGDIRRGALALAAAVDYAAPSVFLAVVDPGVGTSRRALAISAGSHFFVGPDNGLLWLAAERAGGVSAAFDVSDGPAHLEPLMHTFHGRDIFSPVAARLAAGDSPGSLGEEISPEEVIRIELPVAEVSGDQVAATVLARDRYGNLTLNVGPEQIERSFLAPGAGAFIETDPGAGNRDTGMAVRFVSAFGEVDEGEPLLYPDSSGSLALAVNLGDASEVFGLGPDDRVRLSPA